MHITGLGTVSNVGLSAAESGASIRAGISRFSEVDMLGVFDDDGESIGVTGAALPHVTLGFEGLGRWVIMCDLALRDLIEQASLPKDKTHSFWQETPVIWVVPELPSVVHPWVGHDVNHLVSRYTAAVASQLGLPLLTLPNAVMRNGHSGSARALRAMARTISDGHYSRAIVIAADSLLGGSTLQALQKEMRLKTPDNPVGLIPGEAACCMLLEGENSLVERKARSKGVVINAIYAKFNDQSFPVSDDASEAQNEAVDDQLPEAAEVMSEDRWRRENASDMGLLLGQQILDCLKVLGTQVFEGDIYLDINGEEWRSVAWGVALTQLQNTPHIDVNRCQQHVSGTSTGDVGAASGLLNVSLAVCGFTRRYSRSPLSLVCSLSERGHVGVVLLKST